MADGMADKSGNAGVVDAQTSSDSDPGVASGRVPADNRWARRFYLWMFLVVIIPYLIFGIAESSFAATFRSGGASLFICVALAAAFGESIVTVLDRVFSHEPVGPIDSDLMVGAYIAAAGFFAWNMFFAVADKTVRIPTVDWVQIVAFVLGIIYASLARWATVDGPLKVPAPPAIPAAPAIPAVPAT